MLCVFALGKAKAQSFLSEFPHSWLNRFMLTPCVFLQAAGNAVKRASDNLVKAAQKAAFEAQDDQAVVVKSKMVGGIAQVSHI